MLHQVVGFASDKNGHVTMSGIFDADPGTYVVNIDVVSDPPDNVPLIPENREIDEFGYVRITVP